MAISFEAKEDATPVAVEDLIDAARTAYKGNAVEAMQAVAEKFQGLAANREFIRDALLAELNRIANERHLATFAPQSFIIHRAAPFSLRLNLWLPPCSIKMVAQEINPHPILRKTDAHLLVTVRKVEHDNKHLLFVGSCIIIATPSRSSARLARRNRARAWLG